MGLASWFKFPPHTIPFPKLHKTDL